MKKIKIILCLFLFTLSCSQKSKLIIKNGVAIIRPENLVIDDIKEIEWKVGKYKKQRVTKGMSFRVYFPHLEKKDLLYLVKKKFANSWILKISKTNRSGVDVIGRYYVPIASPGRGENEFRIKQIAFGVLKIYYAAASLSSRLERSLCPVMNHNKKLVKYEIKKNYSSFSSSEMIVGPSYARPILGKVEKYSYNPNVMNGGVSFVGSFTVEVALANSIKKTKLSNYYSLKDKIEIYSEKEIFIKGCKGYTQPRRKEEKDSVKEFKFGG